MKKLMTKKNIVTKFETLYVIATLSMTSTHVCKEYSPANVASIIKYCRILVLGLYSFDSVYCKYA